MAASTSAPLLLFFTCSWISVLCEVTQEETGKSGEDVTLQCRGPRGADITVMWIRSDPESDKYVFFFRDGHSYERYQLPSFRGRVELRDPELKDGDVSVFLKNVTVNDSGTYECRVSAADRERNTLELNSTIKLTVTHSGHTAGHNQGGGTEEEGNKDGGNNDGVNKDGNVGLGVVLPVVALVALVALVAVGVVFLIFRNHRRRRENNSNRRPDGEEAHQLQP